jgi:glycosyltransferase involved in cell wall biosynthesis
MIVHAYYEEDPRVRREAESLVKAGRPVQVLGLRQPGGTPTSEVDGVRVHHLDVQRHQGAGLGVYLREYLSFGARAMFAAVRLHRRERFAMVQVHSLPDFLVFAALPLRLAGVPVLLDLHEAMPEFFRSRFPGASNPLVHRFLLLQERLSIAVSTAVITVNPAMRDRLVGLGVPAWKAGVVVNSPSLGRFDVAGQPRRAFREDRRLRLVYTGALTPTYELDVAIAAVARVAAARPELDVAFEVYGRGDSGPALAAQAAELGVADRVTFHGRIPIEDVPAAVARADVGLAPTRHDRFTDMSLSTKVFEYAAMGKPVVASRLPMVEATFPPGTVATYTPGDPSEMANAILALVDDAAARDAAVAHTAEIVRAGSWEQESTGYLALVERLITTGGTPGALRATED